MYTKPCVCEREKQRERERKREMSQPLHIPLSLPVLTAVRCSLVLKGVVGFEPLNVNSPLQGDPLLQSSHNMHAGVGKGRRYAKPFDKLSTKPCLPRQ